MKFQLLPTGTRFQFEGKVYTKVGPVSAAAEDGSQRLIPRYAVLQPLDGAPVPVTPPRRRQIEEATVLAALAIYHSECERLLQAVADATTPIEDARAELEKLRNRFLASLN